MGANFGGQRQGAKMSNWVTTTTPLLSSYTYNRQVPRYKWPVRLVHDFGKKCNSQQGQGLSPFMTTKYEIQAGGWNAGVLGGLRRCTLVTFWNSFPRYFTTSYKEIEKRNKEIMAKLLGVHIKDILRTPKKQIDEQKAEHVYRVLQDFGFSSSSIHGYPDLLLMSPGALENYIRIMQESCFPHVTETFILRFRTVCKQSVAVLQKRVLLPSMETIVNRYCSEIGETEESFHRELMASLPDDQERVTLFDLRYHIIGLYFQKLRICSLEETKKGFKMYPRMYYRSLYWIKSSIDILKTMGFTEEKIKKHFYLLHANPHNLRRVSTIETLGGMDMKYLGHNRPKILMSTYDTLLDIEKSLIDHGIPFEAVQKYPELFTLASSTVRKRLQEMDRIPEFKLLKSLPGVVRLLYYQNKAKSRLEEFRVMDFPAPSLHLLSADTKRFNKSVSTGDLRIRGADAVTYLSMTLKCDKVRVREHLHRHPHWLHIPLLNIKSVLTYLQGFNMFSEDQIIDAIPILLYPLPKVQQEVKNVLKQRDAKLKDTYFLHMVLYFLERPVHFTGDSVWQHRRISGEEEGKEEDREMEGN